MISFDKSRFKGKTISKRMNTAQALLVLLLLVGAGLVVWSEHIHSDSAKNSENLTRAKDRIFFDMVRMSDSMRGLLLDFANTQERRNFDEAEKDLFSNADAIHDNVYRDYSDMLKSLEKLINFNRKELSPYYLQLLTQMAANPGAASANYQTNFPAISSQRQKLYLDFNRQVSTVIALETAQTSVVTAVMGFGAIAIVLIGSLMIGRFQSSAVAGPLGQLVAGIERMRGGDFTQRLELNRQDEFGILSDGFNRLADDLSTIVGQVQLAGGQVNTNAARIADIARGQQVTANEIASTTVWIGGTSKEISTTSRQLVKTMSEVTAVSEETARLAGSGQAAITRMETTMRQIMDASSAITTKLAVLSEKTGNINTVVTTITKVADQTNLLSLNAAIEAEKAGEYGLGFSVVATEIRRLADQTAVATYDIEKMVKEMQSAVTGGVMGMEKFSDEVRLGVEEIRRVSTQLAQIIQQVQTLNPRFQVVSEGMQSQASGAQQITETLVELGDSAQKTADSLRQSNQAIEQLNEAARGLQNSVARFKLKS